ncbi:MAG: hypothetical protein IPG71_11770 [bacterium]|nr:hypothetical protein [bacterium]
MSIAVALCGVVPFLLAMKSGAETNVAAYSAAALSSILLFIGWRLSPSFPGATPLGLRWLLFATAAAVLAIAGIAIDNKIGAGSVICIVMPVVLLYFHGQAARERKTLKHILVPLLVGSIFLFVAAALGEPKLGAFPAAIGALFVAVLRATLDIEEDVLENHGNSDRVAVDQHYRHRLAITAVIFFLFGTVSLWPWLGELYGKDTSGSCSSGCCCRLRFSGAAYANPNLKAHASR